MSSMKYKFIFVETLRGILLTHLNSKLDIRKMPLGPFASKCLVCQFIFNIFHSVILDLLYWIYIFYLSFILYDISSLRYVCTYVIYDINRDMAIVLKKKTRSEGLLHSAISVVITQAVRCLWNLLKTMNTCQYKN